MAAFIITSDTFSTQSDLKSLFDFLSDFENFRMILPEDKVGDFRYSGQECSFTVRGITSMTVRLKDKRPYEYLLFSSEGLAKFDFNLKVSFISDALQKEQCQIELLADMNPFVKTMAEKPLMALINTMARKLSQLNPEQICK